MNQDNFQKGIEDIKNIKMTGDEKSLLFSRLDQYSIPVNGASLQKTYWYANLFQANALQMAFALFVMIGTGGLVLSSNSALPGEFLYSVKVNLSEPLRSISLVDNTAKINWEIEKIDRRFEEIELLAVQGNLDEKKTLEVQSRIESSKSKFSMLLENKVEGAEESSIDFENIIESKQVAHQRILERLENYSDQATKIHITNFKDNIIVKKDDVAPTATLMMVSAKLINEDSSISTSTYKKKKKNVEDKIRIAEDSNIKLNFDNEKGKSLYKEIIDDFRNDLKEARRFLDQAEENESKSGLDEANRNLTDSLKNLESANVYIKQGIRFEKEDLEPRDN